MKRKQAQQLIAETLAKEATGLANHVLKSLNPQDYLGWLIDALEGAEAETLGTLFPGGQDNARATQQLVRERYLRSFEERLLSEGEQQGDGE